MYDVLCGLDGPYVEADMEEMCRILAVIEHCATDGAMITPELATECEELLTILDEVKMLCQADEEEED